MCQITSGGKGKDVGEFFVLHTQFFFFFLISLGLFPDKKKECR